MKKYYAVKNKDNTDRIKSSSGGVFLAVAKHIIENGGTVYGAVYNKENLVVHDKAEKIEDLYKMTGSKYSQSNLNDIFMKVKKDLDLDKIVLFSGTPCQINALKTYTRNNNKKLITIDVVCHGTPDSIFLKDYIRTMEKRKGSKVTSINMRYKPTKLFNKNLKSRHIPIGNVEPKYMKIDFKNGKSYIQRSDFDSYYRMFDYFIRSGCFKCPFAKTERVSDITLGDFHEFNTKLEEFNDGNGVSLVIVNTKKGTELISKIKNKLLLEQKTEKECMQPALKTPTKKIPLYEQFHEDYKKNGFEYVEKKYAQSGIKYKIKVILYKTKLLNLLQKIKYRLDK